jgi:hypothetical protein
LNGAGEMPKTKNTRKQKAKDLLETAIRGPKFFDMGDKPFTVEKAKAQYELWSSSWIIPRLKDLVPELRDKKYKYEDYKQEVISDLQHDQ